jgi:hypothetical protein
MGVVTVVVFFLRAILVPRAVLAAENLALLSLLIIPSSLIRKDLGVSPAQGRSATMPPHSSRTEA